MHLGLFYLRGFMKIISLVIFTLTLSFLSESGYSSEEHCYKQLTKGNREDSSHFRIEGDIDAFGNDFVQNATSAVKALIAELGCSRKDINFMHGPDGYLKSSCVQHNRKKHYSRTCYIETNLGYFFVTWDPQVEVHLIYNRWD